MKSLTSYSFTHHSLALVAAVSLGVMTPTISGAQQHRDSVMALHALGKYFKTESKGKALVSSSSPAVVKPTGQDKAQFRLAQTMSTGGDVEWKFLKGAPQKDLLAAMEQFPRIYHLSSLELTGDSGSAHVSTSFFGRESSGVFFSHSTRIYRLRRHGASWTVHSVELVEQFSGMLGPES